MICLITGGSGCGKSTYAETLVTNLPAQERYYLATMQIADHESQKRVERHRQQRQHLHMQTIEKSKNLGSIIVPSHSLVLLEDLPNWVAGEMFSGGDPGRMASDLRHLAEISAHLILVTNDVFADGLLYSESVQRYMQILSALNRDVARLADHVIEVVYSIPVPLKGALPCT